MSADADRNLLRRYATASTAALFVVVAVSGVMIFFHVGDALVKGLHEWLGLAFAAAAILHVVRNGRPFLKLMARRHVQALCAVVAVVTAAFVLPAALSPDPGGNPMVALVRQAERAPLTALAPVLGDTPDQLAARLAQAGYAVADPADSLADVAAANRVEPRRLLAVLTRKSP